MNVLDDSGIQLLIEGNTVEFQTLLEGEESRSREAETSLGHTAEKMTFLTDAAELEVTLQTSSSLKKVDSSYGKRKSEFRKRDVFGWWATH